LANSEVSMTMIRWSASCAALFLLSISMLTIGTLEAQTTPSPTYPPRGTTATRPGRKQPCWEVAGISQSAMQQHRQIEETTRSQIESVCSDSALAAPQKQQKIQSLRQQAKQQAESVISSSQQEALRSCRAQRGEAPHVGGMHSGGPCGETAPSANHP
jgi:hypothetical protein